MKEAEEPEICPTTIKATYHNLNFNATKAPKTLDQKHKMEYTFVIIGGCLLALNAGIIKQNCIKPNFSILFN